MDTICLADLDFDALAEQLVAIAQRARKHAREGDVVQLQDLLDEVRRSAGAAAGERLALLEVAEAFLRALVRSDLGRSEIALRRFFAEHPDLAETLFARLLKPASIAEADLFQLAGDARREVDELVDLGVLRRNARTFDLRPSMRSIARDLLEPAAFRLWRRVEDARGQLALAQTKPEQAAFSMAAQLGITQPQADAHLAAYPLQPRPAPASIVRAQPRMPFLAGAREVTQRWSGQTGAASLVKGFAQGARRQDISVVSSTSQSVQGAEVFGDRARRLKIDRGPS